MWWIVMKMTVGRSKMWSRLVGSLRPHHRHPRLRLTRVWWDYGELHRRDCRQHPHRSRLAARSNETLLSSGFERPPFPNQPAFFKATKLKKRWLSTTAKCTERRILTHFYWPCRLARTWPWQWDNSDALLYFFSIIEMRLINVYKSYIHAPKGVNANK